MENYYAILELPYNCSIDDIRQQYIKLARQNHPDISKDKFAQQRMRKINEAYAVLSDSDAKAKYDKAINHDKLVAEEKAHGVSKKKTIVITPKGHWRK